MQWFQRAMISAHILIQKHPQKQSKTNKQQQKNTKALRERRTFQASGLTHLFPLKVAYPHYSCCVLAGHKRYDCSLIASLAAKLNSINLSIIPATLYELYSNSKCYKQHSFFKNNTIILSESSNVSNQHLVCPHQFSSGPLYWSAYQEGKKGAVDIEVRLGPLLSVRTTYLC